MNVLYTPNSPPPPAQITGNGLGHEVFVGHFALGKREEKKAAASKHPPPTNTRDPRGLGSPGIPVQRKFQQRGSSAQGGWLCLPPWLFYCCPH